MLTIRSASDWSAITNCYADSASDFSGFNQLQRGASPGGNRGDIGLTFFADARLAKWVNLSGNVGYNYNSSVKGDFPGGKFTLLDRPDELLLSGGVDFPVNKHFQPIFEFRSLKYIGGRTPNVFENNPMDAIAGFRILSDAFGQASALRTAITPMSRTRRALTTTNFTTSSVFLPCSGATQGCVGPNGGYKLPRRSSGIPYIGRSARIHHSGNSRTPQQASGGDRQPAGQCYGPYAQRYRGRICRVLPEQVPASGGCDDTTSITVNTTAVDRGKRRSYLQLHGFRRTYQRNGCERDLGRERCSAGTYTITAGVDDGCGLCGQDEDRRRSQ